MRRREEDHISLCETLDRVLNKGVVITGEVVISVADIDLVYLGLRLVLTSVETARRAHLAPRPAVGVQAGARA
jgi:gas vesicle structural protein